jgi:hypothetical protein
MLVVSGSEVSACLSYISELATFTFPSVYSDVTCVCILFPVLEVVLYCVFLFYVIRMFVFLNVFMMLVVSSP